MNFAEIYAAANDPEFQGRCFTPTWRIAVGFSEQTREASPPPSYWQQLTWANNFLSGNNSISPRELAVRVLNDPGIRALSAASDITDDMIQNRVAEIVPVLTNP